MGFLLSLSWKNLSRYRRRTIITASAIAVGLAVYIWIDAWLYGMNLDSRRNLVWYETGALKIMTERYWDDRLYLPLKHSLEAPGIVERALEDLGLKYTRRIPFAAEIFLGQGSLLVRMEGIDPQTDGRVFRLEESLERGRYLKEKEEGALIGAWLARDLEAEVGNLLTVRCRSRFGSFQTFDLEIVGIYNSPNPRINQGTVYLPLALVDDYLEMEGAVPEVAVLFPGWQEPEAAAARIAATLAERAPGGSPALEVLTWKDLAKDFMAAFAGDQVGTGIMLLLVFIIAAVGISNTMLMAVMERYREIGMMRALGMKDGQIRLAFMLEAAGIGFTGALGGLLLGAGLAFWIIRWGVDFSSMMEGMEYGYRISGLFRGAWHPQAFLYAFVFGIFSSMLFSILPASRAIRKGISDCLRA